MATFLLSSPGMTDVSRARSAPQSTVFTTPNVRRPTPIDRVEIVAPPSAVAEALRPAARLPFALTRTPELDALTVAFAEAVRGGLDDAEMASLRAQAARIGDLVQRDLAESALDTIAAQAKTGPLTPTHHAMLSPARFDDYTERAVAILGHPALAKLREDPRRQRTHDELAMLLVRYTNDPVFLATIERHVTGSGGLTNIHQMLVGEARSLHRIDAYYGQCNETQARTRAIFEGLDARLGGTTLEGFEVTERSTVLLAFGLLGDGPGDHHFLYGVRVPGVGTLYFDPWVDQRADVDSVKSPSASKASRDRWDGFHDYTEHRSADVPDGRAQPKKSEKRLRS